MRAYKLSTLGLFEFDVLIILQRKISEARNAQLNILRNYSQSRCMFDIKAVSFATRKGKIHENGSNWLIDSL